MIKKILTSLLALVLFLSSGFSVFGAISGSVTSDDGYAWPYAQPVISANEHNLTVGELNENKTIINSSPVSISGLPPSRYVVAHDEVTVYRIDYGGARKQTIIGDALIFTDENKSADNGWVMVDVSEAQQWVEVFNGNPAEVLGGSRIYSHVITEIKSGRSYNVYNLADIAQASGGRGVEFGFKTIRGKLQNYTTYDATPRPTGWVKTDKTEYQINETVKITAGGTDFSIYDQGIESVSLSVINKTTGTGFKQVTGATSMPYLPQEPGDYEVTYVMRDTHKRTPLGSPSMSEALQYKAYFTVKGSDAENLLIIQDSFSISPGMPQKAATAATVTFQVKNAGRLTYDTTVAVRWESSQTATVIDVKGFKPGEVRSIPVPTKYPQQNENFIANLNPGKDKPNNETIWEDNRAEWPVTVIGSGTGGTCGKDSQTLMDIRIEKAKSDRELPGSPSNGPTIQVSTNDRIVFTATKTGTFSMNGTNLPAGTGNAKMGIIESVSSGWGRFTVNFKSDDGRDCWQQEFLVEGPEGPKPKCPIVWLSYVGNDEIPTGQTIPMAVGGKIKLVASEGIKNADNIYEKTLVQWYLQRPGETKWTQLPLDDRGKPISSFELSLPYGSGSSEVKFEQPGTYKIKLGYANTNFTDLNCEWHLDIEVKACPIAEQNSTVLTGYGVVPSGIDPAGDNTTSKFWQVFWRTFTLQGGQLDTHVSISANYPGKFYLDRNGQKTSLTGHLPADTKFDLIVPGDVSADEELTIIFESDSGCITKQVIIARGTKSCQIISINTKSLSYSPVKVGEIVKLDPEDMYSDRGRKYIELSGTGSFSFQLTILDTKTNRWSNSYNGTTLPSTNNPKALQTMSFPQDANGNIVAGIYKLQFTVGKFTDDCDGYFFFQFGELPQGENLLIIQSSFAITPNMPQKPSTDATITFSVKNEGKQTYDTTLAVRWASSQTATMLDVKGFKAGETRKITVPTKYPQKSESFIANINPGKDKPDNETKWEDNRAEWPVTVTVDTPEPPGGGGDYDGGEIVLKLFDSDNRELNLNGDGVWEREPTTIKVEIDQTKIDAGFNKVETEVNKIIADYKSKMEQTYQGDQFRNAKAVATPDKLTNAKSLAVYKPASLTLKVDGPGVNATYSVSSTAKGADYVYSGTTVPTATTWRQVLNGKKYEASIDGFVIEMKYKVDFKVTYEEKSCKMEETGQDDDGNPIMEEVCVWNPKSDSKQSSGTYTITVKGGKRDFDVFEPHFKLSLHHTPEWTAIHAKDEYTNSTDQSWYAGEAILTHVNLEERDKHPVSGKYPVILSATSWMREQGGTAAWMRRKGVKERPYWHQVSLALVKDSDALWRGPMRDIPDLNKSGKYLLRNREKGVDNGIGRTDKSEAITMGDLWYGLQPGETYSVQAQVQFRFGVTKGYPLFDKNNGTGSQLVDYKASIQIIDNALSRILNFTHRN